MADILSKLKLLQRSPSQNQSIPVNVTQKNQKRSLHNSSTTLGWSSLPKMGCFKSRMPPRRPPIPGKARRHSDNVFKVAPTPHSSLYLRKTLSSILLFVPFLAGRLAKPWRAEFPFCLAAFIQSYRCRTTEEGCGGGVRFYLHLACTRRKLLRLLCVCPGSVMTHGGFGNGKMLKLTRVSN